MKFFSVVFILSVFLFSCQNPAESENYLSSEEQSEGWELLFDGKTLNGWHLYNLDSSDSSAWKVEDGMIFYDYEEKDVTHEDLVTNNDYENFDLKFDWKIAPEGNSGVFINVTERKEIPTAWASGPEYQLLDSLHPDYQYSLKKRPGVLFNLTEQKTPIPAKAAGEWNHSRIVQKDGKIEFYLNGTLSTEMDLKSPEWVNLVSNSGFATFPDFGKTTHGKISLQRWQNDVWFRNLKIKRL